MSVFAQNILYEVGGVRGMGLWSGGIILMLMAAWLWEICRQK